MIIINQNLKVEDLKKRLICSGNFPEKKLIEYFQNMTSARHLFLLSMENIPLVDGLSGHGFQFGSAVLQYDAAGDSQFIDSAKKKIINKMATHVSHTGVHDHGFNNLSTYGNLLRLMHEGKIEFNEWEAHFYELAIKISGAVQASRWTSLPQGGFIYSFNGPHSLFVDTIRSCRILWQVIC